jgi:hypothetical protein
MMRRGGAVEHWDLLATAGQAAYAAACSAYLSEVWSAVRALVRALRAAAGCSSGRGAMVLFVSSPSDPVNSACEQHGLCSPSQQATPHRED